MSKTKKGRLQRNIEKNDGTYMKVDVSVIGKMINLRKLRKSWVKGTGSRK